MRLQKKKNRKARTGGDGLERRNLIVTILHQALYVGVHNVNVLDVILSLKISSQTLKVTLV